MRLCRRRTRASTQAQDQAQDRAQALAEARAAAARLRREKDKVERYRAGKQTQPADRMTAHQWIAGGS